MDCVVHLMSKLKENNMKIRQFILWVTVVSLILFGGTKAFVRLDRFSMVKDLSWVVTLFIITVLLVYTSIKMVSELEKAGILESSDGSKWYVRLRNWVGFSAMGTAVISLWLEICTLVSFGGVLWETKFDTVVCSLETYGDVLNFALSLCLMCCLWLIVLYGILCAWFFKEE